VQGVSLELPEFLSRRKVTHSAPTRDYCVRINGAALSPDAPAAFVPALVKLSKLL